ncbi:MBOAT family protein [Inquilinus sp. Marseille-Q2685]|uniref:MBOAT family O-acyltransferase n=1 Tax=Inquilinus sp. Marseille-Q2685 TaxID=2866581 RepID=UPI001CE48551|nr:MBOAT family O-acyltransferase [Inquilinus sp. Marseille-Q2685]
MASVAFYGWWSIGYLPLLLGSILFNFVVGMGLVRRPSRALLALGVGVDLLLLGYFKYAVFAQGVVNDLLAAQWPALSIILPIGISFYTFTQIAFLVDAYHGKVDDRDPLAYALFVTFFPHLIAGPILHHKEMTVQFAALPRLRIGSDDIAVGVTMFAFGLFKKTVLADSLALHASPVFEQAAAGHAPSFFAAWTATLGYTLQLYFDFSGYSDMAIGLARLFGIRMPENFNSPYKARSIADFWQRWHMTLSRFLRDYLYIPLGGNRRGKARSYVNAFITMLLGGIWHGAGWQFILWGALHGAYIVVARLFSDWARPRGIRLPAALAAALTFLAVILAWVPFRAPDLAAAGSVYTGLLGLNGVGAPSLQAVALIAVGLAIVWGLPNTQQILARFRPTLAAVAVAPARGPLLWRLGPAHAVALAAVLVAVVLFANDVSEFIYFQF